MDDAGEGLFAKKSLKQVDLKIIGLSNHLLIVTDHDDHQYPGESLFAKKSLKQVDPTVCSDTFLSIIELSCYLLIMMINNLKGELVALMNGARSPPSLHQEWSDYRSNKIVPLS